jgi:hypothetical protein
MDLMEKETVKCLASVGNATRTLQSSTSWPISLPAKRNTQPSQAGRKFSSSDRFSIFDGRESDNPRLRNCSWEFVSGRDHAFRLYSWRKKTVLIANA